MLTLLQANTADLLVQEAAAAPEKMSLIKMAVAGGWLMIVLLILSIISRWWAIRQASKPVPHFMNNIRELVRSGKTSSAISLCRETASPMARLIEKGLERQGNPLPDIQAAVENVANIEVAKLEKGLPMLATVAGGAPMIGFLGTVIGMIQAFYNMASAGSNIDITLLSGGIYTAMVTTVGLMDILSSVPAAAPATAGAEYPSPAAGHHAASPSEASSPKTARRSSTGTGRTAAARRSSHTSGAGASDTEAQSPAPAADDSSITFTIDKDL